jgi:predicted RNA-binding protein with PIN domain
MPASPGKVSRADPLEGTERVLVDGSNLLHALRRNAATTPAATLIGRLRGVIEMPIRIELAFDGPPDPGLGTARIASGLTVRYSGRQSADALLARLASEAADPVTLLIVTDDIELRHIVTRIGARTASARWLIGRLERARLVSPGIGRPRPPQAAGASAGSGPPGSLEEDDERPGWQPGRGATKKKGNPKKGARRMPA